MISGEEIRSMIEGVIPQAIVQVRDLTGSGDHFEVVVVSSQFEGKGMVEQHRLVYASLQKAMKDRIHAVTLKTYTPQEFERKGPA